jgi:hypothetical protein
VFDPISPSTLPSRSFTLINLAQKAWSSSTGRTLIATTKLRHFVPGGNHSKNITAVLIAIQNTKDRNKKSKLNALLEYRKIIDNTATKHLSRQPPEVLHMGA